MSWLPNFDSGPSWFFALLLVRGSLRGSVPPALSTAGVMMLWSEFGWCDGVLRYFAGVALSRGVYPGVFNSMSAVPLDR